MTRAKPDSSKFLLRGVSLHKASHSQPKGAKKKVKKEVRKTTGTYVPEVKRVANPRNTKTSFFKMRGKEIEKDIETKQSKRKSHRSHNTTPGEAVGRSSNPQFVHIEGKRWIKNITKQQKDKSKKLFKHMAKKS